ncbi:hypothetical protein Ahy_B03g063862 isoform A [Arachis hypogaea]|uniref:Uncharacterized protein n=1 Tax=Arachis hypogaea TaxID=3818 RepID=A0A444ZYL2_ARAHY|nr:hypothetical protein Ahy_B03g063862 isoform A [Arachis hypogaea]
MPFIELYIEFEQSEADRNIEREDYISNSEEEFESNYEVVGPEGDEVQGDGTMEANVTDVENALANDHPFEEPSFMRALDLEAMHAPEFPQYMNANGEFSMEIEFSSREAVIMAMKDYTIRRGVDYRVYESEPLTFYAKCTQYGSGCDWLIRVSMISRKYCWVIRRYNGSHTCTRATISQDHSKLDSNTIAEAIKPLVEADPSIKFKAPYLQKLVVNIGYSRIVCEYEFGKLWGSLGTGARCGRRSQAQASNSVSGPSISLQSKREALHNDLYRCARHADPQLYCPILPKSRSKGRNFQCTAAPDLSPNNIIPNNNIMWHFTYL